jgi:hypothetical protein
VKKYRRRFGKTEIGGVAQLLDDSRKNRNIKPKKKKINLKSI